MPLKKSFTDKMEKFCHEYLVDLNATQAAIRAGYSKRSATSSGFELLQRVDVKDRIAEIRQELMLKAELTPEIIINELKALGFWSIKDFVETGNVIKDMTTLDREKLIPVVGVKYTKRYDPSGMPVETTELKMADKHAALVDLGRHLGVFEKDNKQKAVKISVKRI